MSLTDVLAIDCEMVLGETREGHRLELVGRVSIVNKHEQCIYNVYVKHSPKIEIIDYRTRISGLTPQLMANGRHFEKVRSEVAPLIRGRILVGHDLGKDLGVLKLTHLYRRDTAEYFMTERGRPSLKFLAAKHLRMSIQNGVHDSIQDALAAMKLYKKYEQEWEESSEEESYEEESYEETSSSSSSD